MSEYDIIKFSGQVYSGIVAVVGLFLVWNVSPALFTFILNTTLSCVLFHCLIEQLLGCIGKMASLPLRMIATYLMKIWIRATVLNKNWGEYRAVLNLLITVYLV